MSSPSDWFLVGGVGWVLSALQFNRPGFMYGLTRGCAVAWLVIGVVLRVAGTA